MKEKKPSQKQYSQDWQEKSLGDLRRFAVTHSRERPPADAGMKNSQFIIIIK